MLSDPEGHLGLTKDWMSALASYDKMQSFHMVDCFAGKKQFGGWTLERRLECAATFVKIVVRHVRWSTGFGVEKRLYQAFSNRVAVFGSRKPKRYAPVDPKLVGGVYGIAALACLTQISRHMKLTDPDGWVACFAETGAKGRGQLDKLVQMHTKDRIAREASRVNSFTWGDKLQYVSLQAADIVAWALRRDLGTGTNSERDAYAASLTKPLLSIPHVWRLLAPRELELFDRAVRALADVNPTFSPLIARELDREAEEFEQGGES